MITLIKSNFKLKTLYTVVATLTAVALPQLCHAFGGVSLGETLLPMHLPIFILGLLAGTTPAVVAGIMSPLISFLLSGMPKGVMLPFIIVELAVYGAVCGILKERKMSTFLKVLIAQILGRAVRAVAIIIAFFALESTVSPQIIVSSAVAGIFGIMLQWLIIPAVVKAVKHE